jgi:preprotein translocase subunit SecE
MGRRQRKKTSGAKKKQKSALAASANVQTVSDAGKKKIVSAADSSKYSRSTKTVPQKKQPQTTSIAPTKPRDNFISSAVQFLREVKIELKKVTWPSRKQTIGSTVVVLALVMLISLFLGVVDMGLSNLIRVVLQ